LSNTDTGRILVMDIESIVRTAVGKMLRCVGYQVELAANGEEAVRLYRESIESTNLFDAVVMDLIAPGTMEGAVAAQKILDLDPHAKLVLSSAYSSDAALYDYRKNGFQAAVSKPYKMETLHEVLQRIISKSKSGIA